MKKCTILMLVMALCGAMLVGCGCMNSNAEMTTTPTTMMPTTAPTTTATSAPTTAPTTMPTTMPETNPTAMDGSISETAGEDGIVDTDPTTESGMDGKAKSGMGGNATPRSGGTMNPMG